MLKGDKLCGAIVYYDGKFCDKVFCFLHSTKFNKFSGQQNDARMNLAIALTAARQGATVCNHVEVLELMRKKDENGKDKLCGAKVKDTITGKT